MRVRGSFSKLVRNGAGNDFVRGRVRAHFQSQLEMAKVTSLSFRG